MRNQPLWMELSTRPIEPSVNFQDVLASAGVQYDVATVPIRLGTSNKLLDSHVAVVKTKLGGVYDEEVLGIVPSDKQIVGGTVALGRYSQYGQKFIGAGSLGGKPWLLDNRSDAIEYISSGTIGLIPQTLTYLDGVDLGVVLNVVCATSYAINFGSYTIKVPQQSIGEEVDQMISVFYRVRGELDRLTQFEFDNFEVPFKFLGTFMSDLDACNIMDRYKSRNFFAIYQSLCLWADFEKTVHRTLLSPTADRVQSTWFGASRRIKQKALNGLLNLTNDMETQ